MLKERSKFLLVGTVCNSLLALFGIISIIFVFMQLVGIGLYDEVYATEEFVQMGFIAMLIQTGYLLLGSFMTLNGILSIIGFIRKNNDLLLVSIILSAVISILYLIIVPTYGLWGFLVLFITFVLMLIGYIKENKNSNSK